MTLLPAKFNFTIWKGATFRSRLTSYIDEGVTLRDLTGYSALLEIDDPSTTATIYTLSTTNGRITLGGVAGTIDLVVLAADTAALTWKTGVYDLMITAPSAGDTLPLLYGSFTVKDI